MFHIYLRHWIAALTHDVFPLSIFNVPSNGGNTLGLAPRTATKSSNHVGAIVGGVIGGVAFLVFCAFAVFFFVYRHRNRAHRITAARYDTEIEKLHDGSVSPFPLSATTPTTVQFAFAPESTVGSDGMSQMPSPNNATYGRSGINDDDIALDVAPPSYETSEAVRHASQTNLPLTPPSAHAEKAVLHAEDPSTSQTAVAASLSRSPLSTNEPTPSDSVAGSATIYEI